MKDGDARPDRTFKNDPRRVVRGIGCGAGHVRAARMPRFPPVVRTSVRTLLAEMAGTPEAELGAAYEAAGNRSTCYSLRSALAGFRCSAPLFATPRLRNDTTAPGSATSRAKSPPARTCQHVAVSGFVPAHQVGVDGVLSEQHRHRIMNMNGRNVTVRFNAL